MEIEQANRMRWCVSHRADMPARLLADRHYNRQKIGSPQFVPPGRCCVLIENTGKAFWVTSWPFAEYTKHAWPGAWVCSAFRSEDAGGSIELIRQAIAATRAHFGEPPELGMITFVDSRKVKPVMTRGVPSFGWSWIKAGFHHVGKTKAGLLAFQMLPADMPDPCAALPKSMFLAPRRIPINLEAVRREIEAGRAMANLVGVRA